MPPEGEKTQTSQTEGTEKTSETQTKETEGQKQSTQDIDISKLTEEQRAQVAQGYVTEKGFTDDFEVPYNYQGQKQSKRWGDIVADVASGKHRDVTWREHEEKIKNEREEMEAKQTKLRETLDYYTKLAERMKGSDLTGKETQESQADAAKNPIIQRMAQEFDTTPDELVRQLNEAGFRTGQQVTDVVQTEIKKIVDEQIKPLASRYEQDQISQRDAMIRASIYKAHPKLDPESEEYKKAPVLSEARHRLVFSKLEELGAQARDGKGPLFAKYGNNGEQLLKDIMAEFEGGIDSILAQDRETQKKINEDTTPHDTEAYGAAIAEAGEEATSADELIKKIKEKQGWK